MPLYGTNYIFSRPFFRLWVVWTFAWAWAAGLVITILPLWQGRQTLRLVISHIFSRGASSPESSPSDESEEDRKMSSEGDDEKKVGDGNALFPHVTVVPA